MNVVPEYLPSRRLFEVDWDALSDVELLALLIGPGFGEERALRAARDVVDSLGSCMSLKDVTCEELERAGLRRKRSLAVVAALHLFRRIQRTALFPGQPFRSSLEVFRHFQPLVDGLKKECFWNVLVDGKNRIQQLMRISEGSLTSSLVHPREVFRPAIRHSAAGVLFVHNHPSGDPTPSREDIEITKRLVETGKVVGIRVLDHLVIGAQRYISFADQGWI